MVHDEWLRIRFPDKSLADSQKVTIFALQKQMDISKYVTTGVVISSLFKDVSDSSTIYFVGTIVAVSTLIVGLVLTNKKKKKEE